MSTGAFRRTLKRFRAFFQKRPLDIELDAEMETHLELAIEENIKRGLTPEEARRQALIHFGGVEQAKEHHRDARGLPALDSLLQDFRYAFRQLRKNPGFAFTAILTLALGIGANTAIFTVINAVMLRPLPYANPQELVTWRHNESQLDVDDIRAQSGAFFAAGGAVNSEVLDYTGGVEPIAVHAGYIDAGFFKVLGVPAMLGRTLSPEEDVKGGPRSVVLAYPFWREYLGADSNVVGKAIPLSGNSYTVVGVMPESFAAPEYQEDLYVSLRVVYPEAAAYRGVHFMRSYWRLKPGVTLARATAGMATIDARLAEANPSEEKGRHSLPVQLQKWVTGDVRSALWVLFGAVCVVLLIACANFAGLLMARTVARRGEMVIRAALGGGRARLVRQALTECTLLASLGGAAGLVLAKFGTGLLVAAKPSALAHLNSITMDVWVLIFGISVSVLSGLVFGLAPAWSSSRTDVAGAMKQEGRTSTVGPAGHRFRRALVVAEMALALVLLVGAGLLIKSFARLRSVDPGFNPSNVISISIQLPASRYSEIPKQISFRRELLARLNSMPGIEAAMVGDPPLNGSEVTHNVAFEGRPPVAEGDQPEIDTFCVMGDYFHVMQIPLRSGRALNESDRENQPPVAVINEAMARKYYADQNPIGQRIRWGHAEGQPKWMTIVGVAGDVKQYSLAQDAYPAVFTPFAQSDEAWRRWMGVMVRAPGPAAGLIPTLKSQVWSLDNQIPLNRSQSMDELMQLSLAERRFNMLLLGLFAGLALTLSAVGVYGVMSYSVSQRTHEIGIRMAVGAGRVDVLKMVLGQGARLAALGVAGGILGALALTRLMESLLYDVTPTDPATFVAVVLLMVAVVLLACFVPARRATKVDPMVALRYE
jgi:putative ABC transport system permease protein